VIATLRFFPDEITAYKSRRLLVGSISDDRI
jgi:hypothetical protein